MESRVSVDSPRYFVYLLTPPELRDTAVGSNSIYVSRGRGLKKKSLYIRIYKNNFDPKFSKFAESTIILHCVFHLNGSDFQKQYIRRTVYMEKKKHHPAKF